MLLLGKGGDPEAGSCCKMEVLCGQWLQDHSSPGTPECPRVLTAGLLLLGLGLRWRGLPLLTLSFPPAGFSRPLETWGLQTASGSRQGGYPGGRLP